MSGYTHTLLHTATIHSATHYTQYLYIYIYSICSEALSDAQWMHFVLRAVLPPLPLPPSRALRQIKPS